MADLRVKIAKDKAKIVKALRAGENSTGLFQTYYELLAFAAALGVKRGKMILLQDGDASKEIDPIRQEQFASKGYEQLINLVAVVHTKDPKTLGNTEEAEQRRIKIFEGYINGGLDIVQEILRGSDNYSKQLFLLLATEQNIFRDSDDDILDLSFL